MDFNLHWQLFSTEGRKRVKLCNDVITVFNARVDPGTRGDVWVPTVIRGASWFAAKAARVDASRGGLAAAGACVIRIPVEADAGGKEYAAPARYREDPAGRWTLRGGDVIARGAVPDGDWSPAALRAAGFECVTVTGVTDNRRGTRGKHWRVEGKF